MVSELQEILRDAYTRERKLNLLYHVLIEDDGAESDQNCFFRKAHDDQQGDLALLLEINRKYGNDDIDPNLLEKVGEGFLQLRSNRMDREALVRQVLELESQLIETYKSSLRFLSADDQTRKLINRILTVKLVHKRDLMDNLKMFATS
jgi:hypothetical protein